VNNYKEMFKNISYSVIISMSIRTIPL